MVGGRLSHDSTWNTLLRCVWGGLENQCRLIVCVVGVLKEGDLSGNDPYGEREIQQKPIGRSEGSGVSFSFIYTPMLQLQNPCFCWSSLCLLICCFSRSSSDTWPDPLSGLDHFVFRGLRCACKVVCGVCGLPSVQAHARSTVKCSDRPA